MTQEMELYLKNSEEELKELVRQLCRIPAPSHHEEARAEFCLRWFRENGGTEAYIDDALNVVCPMDLDKHEKVTVFMAHMDTVFPDTDPLPMKEENGKLWCPGVCDDTANLAVLMICARYLLQKKAEVKTGMIFVANSCEEGLGNLKGCRSICAKYGDRMQEFITLDANTLFDVVDRVVGSQRYQVTVRTEGGHSLTNFGNRNAIHCLASMITALYTVKVPQEGDSKTTYNVGLISGGTSVNTIAQEASMLYEYRSDNRNCMEKMQKMLWNVLEAYRSMGITVEVEKIGDRPCAGPVSPEALAALMTKADTAIRETLGITPFHRAGSTDCNIPMSMGIPSVCIGVCTGTGCHTRSEVLELDSLLPGSRMFLRFLENYLA